MRILLESHCCGLTLSTNRWAIHWMDRATFDDCGAQFPDGWAGTWHLKLPFAGIVVERAVV